MAFFGLRKDEFFCDVTLACEDRQFQAHKIVLSAGSSFFEQILKSHKHPSPLVYLKGVKAERMMLLLDFMYSGEVMLKQEELENFLKTGEELGVRGLAPSKSTPYPDEVNSSSDNVPSSELVKEFPTPEASSPVKIASSPILAPNSPLKAKQPMMRGDGNF